MGDHESGIDSAVSKPDPEEIIHVHVTTVESEISDEFAPANDSSASEQDSLISADSEPTEFANDTSESDDEIQQFAPNDTNAPPITDFKALIGALCLGAAFAIVGVLFGLKTLATSLLPHILTVGDYISFQELTENLPVPQLLNWNLSQIEALLSISQMGVAAATTAGMLLIGVLLLFCVHTLNPSFKLFHFDHKGGGAVTFSRPHFRKLLLVIICVGIPLIGVWIGTAYLGLRSESLSDFGDPVNSVIWALRLIAIGIALFWGFHPLGLSGSFNRSRIEYPGHNLNHTLMLGAVYGLGVFGILRAALPEPLDYLLVLYQTMGTFHRGYYSQISGHFLLSVSLAAFASGVLLYLMGRASVSPIVRFGFALLVLTAATAGSRLQIPFSAEQLAIQHDMTPSLLKSVRAPYTQKRPGSGVPDGPPAGKELAVMAGIERGSMDPARSRNVILFLQNTAVSVRQLAITEDGLSIDPSSGIKVRNFLEKRKFETALSWSAIKHLYNLGTVNFDLSTALEAILLDLERCPHAAQCSNTARAMFFTCSATPHNLVLLDEYASSKNFAALDRESAKMLGDLYVRFGAVDKALKWYKQADMPKSFMAGVRTEKPMFNKGHISGRLIWNGKPLVGVKVGVIPIRMNGLPGDLEPVLLHTFEELVPRYPYDPYFQPFNPRPYAFRWVTAGGATDANGRFELNSLTQGQYILVFTLPVGIQLAVPVEPRLHITNIPNSFDLNYNHPSVDAGEIRMKFQP